MLTMDGCCSPSHTSEKMVLRTGSISIEVFYLLPMQRVLKWREALLSSDLLRPPTVRRSTAPHLSKYKKNVSPFQQHLQTSLLSLPFPPQRRRWWCGWRGWCGGSGCCWNCGHCDWVLLWWGCRRHHHYRCQHQLEAEEWGNDGTLSSRRERRRRRRYWKEDEQYECAGHVRRSSTQGAYHMFIICPLTLSIVNVDIVGSSNHTTSTSPAPPPSIYIIMK